MVAACADDPTLHVNVVHPQGVEVARTVVSVYQGTFDCLAVEFGDLSADQLAAALAAEETIPHGDLDGISRTDPKIIVARGYASDGRLITEGCAEKDVVTGADEIDVTTVPTATASVALADPTHADAFGLAVEATDPDGQGLDGRAVSWRVYAPSGAMPAASGLDVAADSSWQPMAPSCTQGGVAVIHPVPPSTVGGYAIQARVAWAAEPVPLYSSLVANLTTAPLTPPAGIQHPCAIGHTAATTRLVCLTGGGATQYQVGSDGAISAGASVTVAGAVGVYATDSGEVYAMTAGGNPMRVFPSAQAGSCSACTAVAVDDVMLLPACGASPAKVLVHNTGAGPQLLWMDPAGGPLTAFPVVLRSGELVSRLELGSAGCASELDPAQGTYATQQVAVIDLSRPSGVPTASRAHFACTSSSCQSVDLPVAGGASGFFGGAQPYVIGTVLDATGVVLTSLLLAKNGSADHWVELAREPSAALPHRIVTAQLDDDTGIDKVWDMKTRVGGLIEIAYARQVGDAPLEGLSAALQQQDLVALDLLAGDVTGDGHDDIVIIAQTSDGTGTGVAVAPSHAPAPTGTLRTDPTCAP